MNFTSEIGDIRSFFVVVGNMLKYFARHSTRLIPKFGDREIPSFFQNNITSVLITKRRTGWPIFRGPGFPQVLALEHFCSIEALQKVLLNTWNNVFLLFSQIVALEPKNCAFGTRDCWWHPPDEKTGHLLRITRTTRMGIVFWARCTRLLNI